MLTSSLLEIWTVTIEGAKAAEMLIKAISNFYANVWRSSNAMFDMLTKSKGSVKYLGRDEKKRISCRVANNIWFAKVYL